MSRLYLTLAALAALLAIAFGAFGAHGLRGVLTESDLAIYRTAVDYQMWHALGLGLVALLLDRYPQSALLTWSARLMVSGLVLFSGSLYILSLSGIRWLGAITPLGGLALIAAWLLLAIAAQRLPR